MTTTAAAAAAACVASIAGQSESDNTGTDGPQSTIHQVSHTTTAATTPPGAHARACVTYVQRRVVHVHHGGLQPLVDRVSHVQPLPNVELLLRRISEVVDASSTVSDLGFRRRSNTPTPTAATATTTPSAAPAAARALAVLPVKFHRQDTRLTGLVGWFGLCDAQRGVCLEHIDIRTLNL